MSYNESVPYVDWIWGPDSSSSVFASGNEVQTELYVAGAADKFSPAVIATMRPDNLVFKVGP